MMWTEKTLKYVYDRLCTKYKPRDCTLCPLEKYRGGCHLGLMIEALKEWAEKNISESVLKSH